MDQSAVAKPLQLKTCWKDTAFPVVAFLLPKLLGFFMMVQLGKKNIIAQSSGLGYWEVTVDVQYAVT